MKNTDTKTMKNTDTKTMKNTDTTTTDEPLLALTILKTGVTVGDVILAAGATLRLPKSQAEALASITPPVAEITGI